MYMPTTLPGISAGEARQLLQQTDRLIRTVPEVKSVFGKAGRADTATDPAPLTMIETVIQLKPKEQWRPGITLDDIRAELDQRVRLPGLANAWVMPIKTRIDMLATGIRTPLGIKISGPDLAVIQDVGTRIEAVIAGVDGTRSVYAERVLGGRYITVDVDRVAAARFGLSVSDLQQVVALGVGGMAISTSVEGRERYPIRLRFYGDLRDSPERLRNLPLSTPSGAWIALGDVAEIRVEEGPGMIRSENARPAGWVFVDISDRDLGAYVEAARQAVAAAVEIPAGYSITWSGQYEYLERARARLGLLVPLTLSIIVLLLYLQLRRFGEVLIVLGTLPMSLIGGSVAAVAAGLPGLGGGGCGLYRAGGYGRGGRCRDAGLSPSVSRDRPGCGPGRARGIAQRGPARCAVAAASGIDDGHRHPGGSAAGDARQRRGYRADPPDRRADGRRGTQPAVAVAAGHPGAFPALSPAPTTRVIRGGGPKSA